MVTHTVLKASDAVLKKVKIKWCLASGMAQTTLYLTICVANVMLFGSLLNVNIIIASKVSFSVYVCSDHRLSQPCVVW